MFNNKIKTNMQQEKTNSGGTTLIGAGTTLKGDIECNNDLRIDGRVIGNVNCTAKIVIGDNGIVDGDVTGIQADIVGKVNGNIRSKELLLLRGNCEVKGNLYAGKIQMEPTAIFNGQCRMGTNVVEMSKNEQPAVAK